MFTHYLRDYNCLWPIFFVVSSFYSKMLVYTSLGTRSFVWLCRQRYGPSAVQPTTEYFSYKQAFLGINELCATLAVGTSSICLYCNTLDNGLFLR